LLVPLIAVNTALGMQWMLPLGLDRAFNTITLLAGLINVGLAAALASSCAALGMAWAVVSAEIFVAGSLYLVLRWRKLDLMSRSTTSDVDIAQAEL
jgi:PST family polysaccharide transporter